MLTKRRRKRMDKDASDKLILWLHHEERRCWKACREVSWIKLEKPVKIGYERTYRLKPEIARSIDAAFWEEMLALVNNHIFARKKISLLRPIRKRAKRRLAKWKWEPKLNLAELTPEEFNALPGRKKKYFYFTIGKHGKASYRFTKAIYLEECIRPVFTDKVQVQSLGLINNWDTIATALDKEKMKHRLGWLKGWEGNRKDDWYRKPYKQMEEHHLKNLRSIKKYGYELTNQGCEFRGPDFFIRFPFR